MKDGRGRTIQIGDKIRRIDELCFGSIAGRNGLVGAVVPPAEYERVTSTMFNEAVQTQRSIYCASTVECIGPDEQWPPKE